MKGVYRFYWDCGRMGDLDGVFLADSEEIQNLVGQEVYFGEVLGKHSKIYGSIDEEDIQLLSENESLVSLFEEHIGTVGYNPLNYLRVDKT